MLTNQTGMNSLDDSFGSAAGKTVTVYINGSLKNGKKVIIPLTWTTEEFFNAVSKSLALSNPTRLFNSDGNELQDVSFVEENETVFVSEGGDFVTPMGSDGRPCLGGYYVDKLLGRGGFGEVRLGEHMVTKDTTALKFMSKGSLGDAAGAERIATEIHALTALNHPSIINMLRVINQKDYIVLVFELALGGELRDYVIEFGVGDPPRLPEHVCRNLFGQMIAAS